jgi:molybdate transport system regulatory protein
LEKASGRKGFELSPLGEKLLETFTAWQKEVEEFALKRANELFDWEVHRYVRVPKQKRPRKK